MADTTNQVVTVDANNHLQIANVALRWRDQQEGEFALAAAWQADPTGVKSANYGVSNGALVRNSGQLPQPFPQPPNFMETTMRATTSNSGLFFALVAAAIPAFADDSVRLDTDRLVSIHAVLSSEEPQPDQMMFVFDDALYFQSWATDRNDPQLPTVQKYSGSLFEKGADTLRLFGEQNSRLGNQVTKYGWYLTADYSTSPPTLILTEQPGKHSYWTFVPVTESPRNRSFYLKNENDAGGEAWLDVETTKTLKNLGKVVANLRRPILSDRKRISFNLIPRDLNTK